MSAEAKQKVAADEEQIAKLATTIYAVLSANDRTRPRHTRGFER